MNKFKVGDRIVVKDGSRYLFDKGTIQYIEKTIDEFNSYARILFDHSIAWEKYLRHIQRLCPECDQKCFFIGPTEGEYNED